MKNLALRDFLIYTAFFAIVGGALIGVYSVCNRIFYPPVQSFIGITYNEPALVISEVVPNSPAEEAGIKVDDRIVSINGVKMLTAERVKQIIATAKVGIPIKIVILRAVTKNSLQSSLVFDFVSLTVTPVAWPYGLHPK